jgi:drug/metabolite transporter (DMT)-like permease
LIGYFFAGEPLGLRTILGTVLVLASVLLITVGKSTQRKTETARRIESEPCAD